MSLIRRLGPNLGIVNPRYRSFANGLMRTVGVRVRRDVAEALLVFSGSDKCTYHRMLFAYVS